MHALFAVEHVMCAKLHADNVEFDVGVDVFIKKLGVTTTAFLDKGKGEFLVLILLYNFISPAFGLF